MKYQFIKEPAGWDPLSRKKEGIIDDLPQSLRPILEDMVKRPEVYQQTPSAGVADANNYELHVDSEGQQFHFSFRDLQVPANAAPLIDYLRQNAK